MARKIKERYKQEYPGERLDRWIPRAIKELEASVKSHWKGHKGNDLGLVLLKCSEMTAPRVQPGKYNWYGYEEDLEPTFGVAKKDEALEFFFRNRDPPRLQNEI